ncbi:MAG: Rieske 2Fe-2S domain-containing protein [Rhodospirillales bacterium]
MSQILKDRRPSFDDLVKKMEMNGYKFLHFENSCEDPCLPIDVEWNYKDLVHVGYVHSHMHRQFFYIGENIYTSIDLQKIFGLTLPQSCVFYVTEDNKIVIQTTLFYLIVFVEIGSKQIGEMQTLTRSRYAVGARSSLFHFLAPIIRYGINRNWKKFVADDKSLRVRRGTLRKKGFSFVDVSPIDHRETLNVAGKGIYPPSAVIHEEVYEFDVSENLSLTRQVGESDHLGVQIRFEPETIRIFPRLCPHRGASLDIAGEIGPMLECPWHGRKFHPVATIKNDGSRQVLEGRLHHCVYEGKMLKVRIKSSVGMDEKFDWTEQWHRK